MVETTRNIRIETDRLILRPPRPQDAERIATLIADYDIVRMLSGPPWPYRLEDAQAYLAMVAAKDPALEQPFAIEHREHGFIGSTGFHHKSGSQWPEFGYWIARDQWGQGYATEAAHAALIWARRDWGKKAVEPGHFHDNPTSGRVLVKAGFLYTGIIEPTHSPARGEAVPSRKMIWLA